MASQLDALEISSTIARLMRSRDMSLFLPFILGFSNNLQTTQSDQQTDDRTDRNDTNARIILVNPFTQGLMVMEGASSLESLLREIGNGSKEGQPPASKSAVKALPRVEITEENGGEECAICLEEFRAGDWAKEMPCQHRFHGDCVEKWLGIHGTCPICRHKMPVEERENESKNDFSSEREIWVRFSVRNNTRNSVEEEEDEVEEDDEEEVLNQNGSTDQSE